MFRSLVIASLILTAQPVLVQSQTNTTTTASTTQSSWGAIIIQNTVDPLQEESGKIKLILLVEKKEVKKEAPKPVEAITKTEVKSTPAPKATEPTKEIVKPKEDIQRLEPAQTTTQNNTPSEKSPAENNTLKEGNPSKVNTFVFEDKPQTPIENTDSIIPTKTIITLSSSEVQELIKKYSQKYNLAESDMLRIAKCESNFRTDLIASGRYHGVFQFSLPTYEEFTKKLGIIDPDPLNPEQNIEVAAYMFANGQNWRWGCK